MEKNSFKVPDNSKIAFYLPTNSGHLRKGYADDTEISETYPISRTEEIIYHMTANHKWVIIASETNDYLPSHQIIWVRPVNYHTDNAQVAKEWMKEYSDKINTIENYYEVTTEYVKKVKNVHSIVSIDNDNCAIMYFPFSTDLLAQYNT